MNTLSIGSHTFSIPSTWAEIDAAMAADISPYMGVDTMPNRISLLCTLSRKPQRLASRLILAAKYAAGWQAEVLKLVDWVYGIRPLDKDLVPILPGLRWRGQNWLLPQKNMADVTLEEWAYIESYLIQYGNTQEAQWLMKLALIVVRPEKPLADRVSSSYDGNPREALNPELLDHYLNDRRKLPLILRHAAMEWATLAVQWLPKQYPGLYATGTKASPFRTQGLMMSIAERGTFGPMDDVKKLLVHSAMIWMMKQQYDERQKQKDK